MKTTNKKESIFQNLQLKDSAKAFAEAIELGVLSSNTDEPNFAGNYMYMYTDNDDVDFFKNIDTRKYLSIKTLNSPWGKETIIYFTILSFIFIAALISAWDQQLY